MCSTAKCITKSETWAQDNKIQTVKQPNYGSFDGEPTECKVMFNSACMLHTDEINLCGMKLVLYSYAWSGFSAWQCSHSISNIPTSSIYLLANASVMPVKGLGQLEACTCSAQDFERNVTHKDFDFYCEPHCCSGAVFWSH